RRAEQAASVGAPPFPFRAKRKRGDTFSVVDGQGGRRCPHPPLLPVVGLRRSEPLSSAASRLLSESGRALSGFRRPKRTSCEQSPTRWTSSPQNTPSLCGPSRACPAFRSPLPTEG